MVTAENLRGQASKHNDQYVVQGRKALRALMVEVYTLYYQAKESPDKGVEFLCKVQAKLKELNVEVRKSSPETSQLIRYICKDFDDKQVSIYGRSLTVAFSKEVAPDGFAKFIEGSEGGFAGVRSAGTPVATGGAESPRAEIGLANAQTEVTIKTIEVNDWGTDEDYRVLIAIRNDDDTADIKNAKLSEKSLKAVITRYETDRRARLKPPKNQELEVDKAALKELEIEARNAKVKLESTKAELKKAKAENATEMCNLLRPKVKAASMQYEAVEASRKQLRETLKEAVAA